MARALGESGRLGARELEALSDRFGPEAHRALDRLLARQDQGQWRWLGRIDAASARVRGRRADLGASPPELWSDPALELAALSAALRGAGRADLAEQLLAAYALERDDYVLFGVVDFLECLLACEGAARAEPAEARDRLAPWLRQPDAEERYLIVLTGGVASGKSTLARALVRRLAAPRVEADRVRAAVLAPVEEQAGPLAALDLAWSGAFHEQAYAALLQRAEAVVASGRTCIVDACTPRAEARAHAAQVAERHGAELVLCTCLASPASSARRLRARDERDGVEAGTWERIAGDLNAHYQAIAADEPGRHVYVRTDARRADCVAAVRAVLGPVRTPRGPQLLHGRGRPPRAVTFDCWNALLTEADWSKAHALRVDALAAAVREAGEHCDRDTVSSAFDRAWRRHMDLWREGLHSGAPEIARWSLEFLGLPLSDAVVGHLTERFQTGSHSGLVIAVEGARATLERLSGEGVALALVCDTGLTPGRVVRQHLERLGLLEHLQAQLFSDEIGVPKPDARIFRAALGGLGVAPRRAVHVGDLLRTDVAGARALGMGSIRLRQVFDDPTNLPEADAVAEDHEGVRALLGVA